MASAKLLQHPQLKSRPIETSGTAPACVIHSKHPLALCLIRDAVCSDSTLCSSIQYATNSQYLTGQSGHILIIDTCSVEGWTEYLKKWHQERGQAIALVSAEARTSDFELQLLYLGASGILTFADNLVDYLPKAIRAVAEGNLWIRREVLNIYVRRANSVLRSIAFEDQRFTDREKQIIDLLQLELSNRTIAQRLAISERTTKFHISNILRKLNVSNRRELRMLSSSAASHWPAWLLHEESADIPGVSTCAHGDKIFLKCGT